MKCARIPTNIDSRYGTKYYCTISHLIELGHELNDQTVVNT